MAGVGTCHSAARLGLAHLEDHDGGGGLMGRLESDTKLLAILETFDVGANHRRLGVISEVSDEVGHVEVYLVAGGDPTADDHSMGSRGDEWATLITALGHQPNLAAPRR